MIWIVLTIVVFVGAYTFISLRYRKPGRAYQPAEDTKNRVNTSRLLSAGYQRVHLSTRLPTSAGSATNTAEVAPGGLPDDLRTALISPLQLPVDVVSGHGASTTTSNEPYELLFRCVGADDSRAVAGAELYVKGNILLVAPQLEKLGRGLHSRTRDHLVQATIPPSSLKPGNYRLLVVGERLSQTWNVQVK